MARPEFDSSYDPSGLIVCPPMSDEHSRLLGLAQHIEGLMTPLNTDARLAEIEALLVQVTAPELQFMVAGRRSSALATRTAMLRMGEGRRRQGLDPVPDDLKHLE